MRIADTVRRWLAGDAAVSALVSTRVFFDVGPENAVVPYVCVQRVAETPTHGLRGPTDLREALVQVTGWALDEETRTMLADAIRGCIESRALGDGTVMRVAIEAEGDGHEFEGSGSAQAYRSARFDVSVSFRREPAPAGG